MGNSLTNNAAANNTHTSKKPAARWIDRSRLSILTGWFVSMCGIVLYCFATLHAGTVGEVLTLQETGWAGMIAVFLVVIGVVLWLYGAATSLHELELQASQANNDWRGTF